MKMRATSFVLACAAVLLPGFSEGRTWVVLPGGSGDAPTIQAGIDSAAVGDTVLVGCGTYPEFNIQMKGGICLRGEMSDSACVVIDAEDDGRVMICDDLAGATRIEWLRFIRGVNPTSGADRDGAGLYCRSSSPLITGCVFDDNYCSWVNGGGMVATDGSAPVLTRCGFTNNTAGNYGGGLYCVDSSAAVVQDCEFVGNFASWWGGGLACGRFSDASITDCVFRGNTTNHYGGGFAAISRSMPTVATSLFLENQAGQYGGAVAGYRSSLPSIVNCTIYGNYSPSGSAVFARDTAQVSLDRCIVSGGNSVPAVRFNNPAYILFSCSDVHGNLGGDWVGSIAGQDTVNGNLCVRAEFCGAGSQNFTLASTSPCLNAPCGAMGAFGEGCALPPGTLWYVKPDGTGDAPTIQAAMDSASNGDTLVLASGVFSGPGNRDLDARGKQLTVYSESGDPETCIIDCGGSPGEPHAGFRFRTAYTRSAFLAGVTIRNAYVSGSYPASTGGGIYVEKYTFTMRDCVFESNTATYGGGAVYSSGATLKIDRCICVGNTAPLGSAIGLASGSSEITECEFSGNGSETSGHAVFVGPARATFTRCAVKGNIGGGVRCEDSGTAHFDECSIVDNVTSGLGGGARVWYELALYYEGSTFRRCLFAGNSAGEGGAVYAYFYYYDDVQGGIPLVLDSCAIAGNRAADGSALWYQGVWAGMDIRNTIIAFNDSGNTLVASGYHYACPFVSCTDIYGNAGGDWTGCVAGLLGIDGNVSVDPSFCDAEQGDFSLDASSPCLNAPGCGRIGAFGQGCDVITEVASGPTRVPSRPFLSANRPNPFNAATSIRFGLPDPALVVLSVLDVTGRRIATLDEGPHRAGEFLATWDGTDDSGRPVGSGIYFFRLDAADFQSVRKAILLR